MKDNIKKGWLEYINHENFEASLINNGIKIAEDIAKGNECTPEMKWYITISKDLLEDKEGTPMSDDEVIHFIAINNILNNI